MEGSNVPVLTLQQEREMKYHEAALEVESARRQLDKSRDSNANAAARDAYLKAVLQYHRTRIH